MREERPSPTQGRVGVMTPAGGDRFLGWGELGVLAGTHEASDTSSRLGNDHTEDAFTSDGNCRKCHP